MRWLRFLLGLILVASLPLDAETVLVDAARDATLIEDPGGAWADGSGPYLRAGRTSQSRNSIRRGLLYFDVAAVLPDKAVVEGVSLRLFHKSGNNAPTEVRLQRLLAPWGEGPSSSSGGGGAPSLPGDATWIHSSYENDLWVRAGGQFLGRVSARREVGGNGSYTWEKNVHLVQDVRLWNVAPRRNFGWIVIGDESMPQNAKKFASRENPDASKRPLLEITYRVPGTRARRR